MPLLLTVGLGFPLFVLIKLHRNRHQLADRDVVTRYGFFYKSYKNTVPYWEIVIYARKALIGAIAVFAHLLKVEVQSNLALTVLLVSLVFQSHLHPFLVDKLNVMEMTSIVTLAFVFVIGGLVNSNQGGDTYKAILSLLLVIVESSFILYVLSEIFEATMDPLRDWLMPFGREAKSVSSLPLVFEALWVIALKIWSSKSDK